MGDVVGRLFREFAITLAGHHPDLGRGVADPGADGLRQAAARPITKTTRTRSSAAAAKASTGSSTIYGHALNWVLDHQTAELLVALATFVLTALPLCRDPQGLLPAAGHRRDPGDLAKRRSRSPSRRWRSGSSSSPASILKDPDVDSLSSFIGVDGTNTTLNNGRFLINLKPHDQRKSDIATDHRAGSTNATGDVTGISLYMQPVQDLTIEGTVSRTQYQFILAGRRSRTSSRTGRRSWSTSCSTLPQLERCRQRSRGTGPVGLRRDRPRPGGALRHHAGHRRQCALRLLRPAHRLDHLHQLQPVPRDPRGRSGAAELAGVAERHLSALLGRLDGQVPLAVGRQMREQTAPLQISHLGQFPVGHDLVQPGAGRLARRGGRPRSSRRRSRSAMPPSVITEFPGRGAGLPVFARRTSCS